jgi:hypothetical protein
MSEQEDISTENPQESPEIEKNLCCYLAFQMDRDHNLSFDILWNEDKDLDMLAVLINAIRNTNFINTQLDGIETDSPESIAYLKAALRKLNEGKPVITPDRVLHNEQ